MHDDGMSDVERLVALEAIRRLKARRDRAVDNQDWATYEALHLPEHRSHNDGFAPWQGAAEMVRQVSAIMAGVTSAHHSHTPEIDFQSPIHATGIWSMEDNLFWRQGDEDHWLNGFGFYHETYEKRDDEWRFSSRRLQRTHVRTSPGALFGTARVAADRR